METIRNLFGPSKPDPSYCHYVSWIPKAQDLCKSLPSFEDLRNVDYPNLFSDVGTFAYQHKEWLAGTIFTGITVFVARRFWKNRAQRLQSQQSATPPSITTPPPTPPPPVKEARPPTVNMESSLNYATLSVEVTKRKVVPPNANITFCIDTSGSMVGAREQAVKEGLNNILNTAQNVLKTMKKAQIRIAAVGFDSQARSILLPTELSLDEKVIEDAKTKLISYHSDGETKIFNGLSAATDRLEEMAKKKQSGNHTLILLSDGEETCYAHDFVGIRTRLARVGAKLFAIGIGEKHNKDTLRTIAQSPENYIDASSDNSLITRSISSIFNQALASYTLGVNSALLPRGTWSVDGTLSTTEHGLRLGTLLEGNVSRHIQIHPERLPDSLNLSTVTFDLHYTDPRGRKGVVTLPWNPNTIVNPKICNPRSQASCSNSSS